MNPTNQFVNPTRLPLVAASILSADFARLGEECDAVIKAGSDLLHLDVMDGHFVSNLTMGPAVCASIHKHLPDALLDVHLMVTDPEEFIEPFANAGAGHITFHIEANGEPDDLIDMIHEHGMTAGVAISPPTEAHELESIIERVELVLLMTVNPGYAGQKFMTDMLEKGRAIRSMLRNDQRLGVDGGVSERTAESCRDAGCDVLIAASAIFGSNNYASVIEAMRGPAKVRSGGA